MAKNLSVFGLLYISTLQSKFRRQRHDGIFPNFPEGKTLSSCEVSRILFSLNINIINIFVDKRYFLDLDVSNLKAVKRWVISRSNIVIDTAMFICVSRRKQHDILQVTDIAVYLSVLMSGQLEYDPIRGSTSKQIPNILPFQASLKMFF